jgi:hypothetical protein
MTDYATDIFRLLSILLSAVTAGFACVVWWIIKGLGSDIRGMREELVANVRSCSDKFRTKTEAAEQWSTLKTTLDKAEAVAKERHEQVWKKIDNQTALFMQEKGCLANTISSISERLTRNEICVETLKEKKP